jgi:predicted ribonuclease YlaK
MRRSGAVNKYHKLNPSEFKEKFQALLDQATTVENQGPRATKKATESTAETAAAPESKFRLLTVKELLQEPRARWLINKLFEIAAFVVLYGRSGEGKTFLALDLALCIAFGIPWNERPVIQGPVVYIVGEGSRGVRQRVVAWMREHNVDDVPGAFFLLQAPQLLKE